MTKAMLGNASYVNLRSWILPCGESPNELLSCKTGINQLVHFPKSGMESLVEEKAQAEYKFLFLTFLSLAVARLLGISHNLFSSVVLHSNYQEPTRGSICIGQRYIPSTNSVFDQQLVFAVCLGIVGNLEKITPSNDFSIEIRKKPLKRAALR